jgi:hypothetical protein
LELTEPLNNKPKRTEIPHACNQLISLTESMAGTRDEFHNHITGSEINIERIKINPMRVTKSVTPLMILFM